MRPIVRGLATLSIALILAACSGGGAATTGPGATTGPAATTGTTATEATARVCAEPTDPSAPADVEALVANNKWGPVGAKVGEVITWSNDDSVPHRVELDDGSCKMEGNIPGGGTHSLVFSEAGIFAFHCGIHSSMKGSIVVQ
jgi:plastocyanin